MKSKSVDLEINEANDCNININLMTIVEVKIKNNKQI